MPESEKHYSESVYPEQARKVLSSQDLLVPPGNLAEMALYPPDPSYTRHVDEFAYDPEAVSNLEMAIEYKMVEATMGADDTVEVRFLPLTDVPDELGHVTSLEYFQRNINQPLWGDPAPDAMSYLQATDFSVEPNHNTADFLALSRRKERLVFLYIDTKRLLQARHIYADPESLDTTPLEFGAAYTVLGGIPRAAITRAEYLEIDGAALPKPTFDMTNLMTEEERERSHTEQVDRLRRIMTHEAGTISSNEEA